MVRLTIFAKGNSDVAESLFACPDERAPWNGLNEALRAHGRDDRIRLRHETFTRSDALLAATGVVPPQLRHLTLARPYDMASQFSNAIFDGEATAIVLSIQPDITISLLRHRASGEVFHPGDRHAVSVETRDWMRAECEVLPLLTPEQSLENFTAIVARLRRRSSAPILLYNLSTVIPGEGVDNYMGLGETLTTRIKRFNLSLVALSSRCGVSIVDVDRIAACAGADRVKLDSLRLNRDGCSRVAEDVLRILDDHGCFSPTG